MAKELKNFDDLKNLIIESIAKMKAMSVKGILGLDVGYSGIKMSELSLDKSGDYTLKNFAYTPFSPGVLIEDQIQDPNALIEAITASLNETKTPIRKVCFGLFGENIIMKRLSIPEGEKEEMEDNVMWESQQYIPFGSDNATIKFDLLGKNEGGGMDVVVAAAKTEYVEKITEIIEQAKVIPVIIDLNAFALNNIFEYILASELSELSKGTVILDIGAQTTKILIYKNKGPYLYKEHAIGGSIITEEIQRVMGVSYEEAELLKTSTDEEGNLPEEVAAIIQGMLVDFIEEIKKTLNFFIAASSTEHVYYCYITGGGARLPGLAEEISNFLGLEVNYLDLFSKIKYDQNKFDEASLFDMNFSGAVSFGLGMREG